MTVRREGGTSGELELEPRSQDVTRPVAGTGTGDVVLGTKVPVVDALGPSVYSATGVANKSFPGRNVPNQHRSWQ